MATLNHKEAYLSIDGAAPFGIDRITLSDNEKHALRGAFITHHFDVIHVYANSAERGPAYKRFRTNACTGQTYIYTMYENNKAVKIKYVAMPVVILGDIEISKIRATGSFENIGYGYNHDATSLTDSDIGDVIAFGSAASNILATIVVREVTREDKTVSLHYELHVCLT